MKSIHCIILVFLFSINLSYSQKDKDTDEIKFDKKQFLKELSDNACKCIDSISTFDKIKDSVVSEINRCIDKQVGAYQMGVKLADIAELTKKATADGKKEINIDISFNPNSKEYKDYYYELERYLNNNCKAVKNKIAVNDKVNSRSLSSNDLALDYYNKGLDATKLENFQEAINNYKKAVTIDPQFAFAYDNMGICYRRLDKYDEAINAYEKSLKIDPNSLMPLQNIAIAYVYKKEYKKAVKSYEKLGEIQPDNPEVFYGTGLVYFQNLKDLKKGLDNMCKAYLLYIAQKSPYRSDAEKIIQMIYNEYKEKNKIDEFNAILEKHNISQD